MTLDQQYNEKEGFARPYSFQAQRKQELAIMIERELATAGVPFQEITRNCAQRLTETLCETNHAYPSRREAMQYFETNFLERSLRESKGNITQTVRNIYGIDDPIAVENKRRTLNRWIDKYDLRDAVSFYRPWQQTERPEEKQAANDLQGRVENSLMTAVAEYKETLKETIYDGISSRIKEAAPTLASRIEPYLPTPRNMLKEFVEKTEGKNIEEARNVFESQVITAAVIAAQGDRNKAAEYLGESVRTLNRRISHLGLETIIKANSTPDHTEEKRLIDLVLEYNARRERMRSERQRLQEAN